MSIEKLASGCKWIIKGFKVGISCGGPWKKKNKGVKERRKPLEEGEERFDTVNSASWEKRQQLSREVRLLLLRAREGTQQYSG